MKNFIKEFREFISRGSVMDLAVGVIIGGAFQSIINSLVNDIIMPLIGIIVGQDSFASLSVTVGGAVITYGNFISAILNFLIMAFVLFLIVRTLNRMKEASAKLKKKEEEAAAEEATKEPSAEEALLTEIRDLLKAQK